MRPISLFSIYFTFTFLGAALFAPWIYKFVQAATNQAGAFQQLAHQPFHRYVNRSLLLLALVGLWPFLRSLGIRSWKDLGFAPVQLHWRRGVTGFFVGFWSMAALALLAIFFGARRLDFGNAGAGLIGDLLGATLTAAVVAILEETLFRGALFGALRKNHPWPFALVASSALYALLHFFAKATSPVTVMWSSGFLTLSSMLRGFVEFQLLVPGFFNLLIAGAILALAYQRTGNLYFSIGLHAGWIFWLRSYRLLTKKIPGTDSWFWGGREMMDGWLATIVLTILFCILFTQQNEVKAQPDIHGNSSS